MLARLRKVPRTFASLALSFAFGTNLVTLEVETAFRGIDGSVPQAEISGQTVELAGA
jgi:hypothetical protein